MRTTLLALALALVVPTAAGAEPASVDHNTQVAIDFYNALAQGDEIALRKLGREDYIQHNPAAENGLDGVLAFFKSRPKPAVKPEPLKFHRTIAQGDLVMLQQRVPAPTADDPDRLTSVIDIFRIQDGKVAEHWDYIETFTHGSQRGDMPPRNVNGVF